MNDTTLCIQKWEWPSSVQLKWMAEMKLEQLVELWEWQEQQLLYPQVCVMGMLSLQLVVGAQADQLYKLSCCSICQE